MRKAKPILELLPETIWEFNGNEVCLFKTGERNTHEHETFWAFNVNLRVTGKKTWSIPQLHDIGYVKTDRELEDEDMLALLRQHIRIKGEQDDEVPVTDKVEEKDDEEE